MSEAQNFELELLAQLAEAELDRQGPDHPTADRLAAYHAKELSDRETEELKAHLAVCRNCTRDLLDLLLHEDAEERARALIGRRPRITLPAWVPAALAHRIPGFNQRISDLGPLPGNPDPRKTRVPSSVLVYAVAAGLAGCVAGIPLGYVSHYEKPQPIVVAALPNATHGEVTRGERKKEPLTIDLPATGSAPTLVWPLPEPRLATYRVEIQNSAGETLLAAEAAPVVLATPREPRPADASPPRVLAVELPPEQLKPGDYQLLLTGLPQGETYEYPLRIRKGL